MKLLFIAFIIILIFAIAMVSFFAYMAHKYRDLLRIKKRKLVEENSQYRKREAKPGKKDDFRSRDQKQEKKLEEELVKTLEVYDPNPQLSVSRALSKGEDMKIIGVAKPVGFWSKFVMSQKMGYIMTRMQMQTSKDQKGYWVNLMKAQAASQGKEQGRGR